MSKIRLTYFNLTGRGETTRMLFGISGIPFEDKKIEFEQWPALKPNTPWGTLPILEIEGKVVGQSKAVHRFAANKAGLAGKTPIDAALADSIVDAICDAYDGIEPVVRAKDEITKVSLIKQYEEKTLAPSLQKLEKMLVSNNGGTGYFVGSEITWADVHFFVCFEQITKIAPEALNKNTPRLKGLYERVQFNTKVRQYLAKRPFYNSL